MCYWHSIGLTSIIFGSSDVLGHHQMESIRNDELIPRRTSRQCSWPGSIFDLHSFDCGSCGAVQWSSVGHCAASCRILIRMMLNLYSTIVSFQNSNQSKPEVIFVLKASQLAKFGGCYECMSSVTCTHSLTVPHPLFSWSTAEPFIF